MFVKTLGIHSLIREGMNANDAAELSRLTRKYGGNSIGSFRYSVEDLPLHLLGHETIGAPPVQTQDLSIPVYQTSLHALFMDCTHDNETPHQKRTAIDTLPNAAIVAMSDCAVGSVKGYDEIVPELLNVVSETKKYRVPDRYEGYILLT